MRVARGKRFVRRLFLLATLIAPKAAFAGTFEDTATELRVVLRHTDNICVVVPNELRDERDCEGIDVSQVERGVQQASGTRHLLFGLVRDGNDIFMLTLMPDDVYGHGAGVEPGRRAAHGEYRRGVSSRRDVPRRRRECHGAQDLSHGCGRLGAAAADDDRE